MDFSAGCVLGLIVGWFATWLWVSVTRPRRPRRRATRVYWIDGPPKCAPGPGEPVPSVQHRKCVAAELGLREIREAARKRMGLQG